MLARMDENFLMPAAQFARKDRYLHKLGARADN
jgi:hypothetical protein